MLFQQAYDKFENDKFKQAKDNFADYNVISNLLVSLSNLTCSSQ
jgi:hypothetical protein